MDCIQQIEANHIIDKMYTQLKYKTSLILLISLKQNIMNNGTWNLNSMHLEFKTSICLFHGLIQAVSCYTHCLIKIKKKR